MPKEVNAQERREHIADGVFSLLEKGGIEVVSFRNIAKETGLNVGSVRHFVGDASDMLILAAEIMAERVERRIWGAIARYAGEGSGPQEFGVDACVEILEQLLPLDAARRREVIVWQVLTERARTDAELRKRATGLIDGAFRVTQLMLDRLAGIDSVLAARTLAATVDGLSVALLDDPESLTVDEVSTIVSAQLRWIVQTRESWTS